VARALRDGARLQLAVAVFSLGDFRSAALAGSGSESNRYGYVYAEVVLDKLDAPVMIQRGAAQK
jgi:hypothetical protein